MSISDELKVLEAALRNAVKPNYDLHVHCPNCAEDVTTNNGEWLLWCGTKEHAEALLTAAREKVERLKNGE